MRITAAMVHTHTLNDLQAAYERLARTQAQLATGKRLGRPSDDPTGIARALGLRAERAEVEQYQRNIDEARGWLGATDDALSSVKDLLHRARELAVQLASDTNSAEDRLAALPEVEQLHEQAVVAGNSRYAGQYLFAGTRTTDQPFSYANGSSAFNFEDGGLVQRAVGVGQVITVNVVGHRSDPADPAVFDRVFAAFEQLRAALSANDAPAIEGSIAAFDDALDAVLIEQSRMGAAISRLDTLSSQLGLLSVNLTDQQSRIEDADLAEVTMNLSMQQAVYEAALAAAAKVLQPTLLNFLNG